VRYPRGAGAGVMVDASLTALPYAKAEIRRDVKNQSKKVAILAFGTMLQPALAVAEKIDATVVNMRWVKPLDVDMLKQIAETHDVLVTVEEGAIMGGAGSAVGEALQTLMLIKPLLQLGLPDVFIEHGDPVKLLSMQGLDALGIEASIGAFIQRV
jgi:1-deoxy-D-xylulose-5-phosphate synthase